MNRHKKNNIVEKLYIHKKIILYHKENLYNKKNKAKRERYTIENIKVQQR